MVHPLWFDHVGEAVISCCPLYPETFLQEAFIQEMRQAKEKVPMHFSLHSLITPEVFVSGGGGEFCEGSR